MQILILDWRDSDHPRAGGSEVYVNALAQRWAELGHDVTLFCGTTRPEPYSEIRNGYRVVGNGGTIGVYRQARLFYKKHAGEFTVILDVVNTRPFFAPKWAGNTPVFALIYQLAADVWKHEVPLPAAILGERILEPRWLKTYKSVPVLTISESSKASFLERGLTDITVLPVGVNPVPLDHQAPKESVPTIIWVGRLSANKRPDHAIEAFKLLKKKLPDAQLWVVGDGPMMNQLRKTAPEGVTFHGRVDQLTKHRLMSSAHALVATSVREGWGLIVSEAGLLGTPAVGYDVPGLRDSIAAAGGHLVDPSPQSLATALTGVLPTWMQETPLIPDGCGVTSWAKTADEVIETIEVRLKERLDHGLPDLSTPSRVAR